MFTSERQDFRQDEGEADASGEFFDAGFGQVFSFGDAEDAWNAAAPLFDQFQFSKHAGDDRISDLGDALLDVFDGQTGKEQTWAFNLDPVVEKGHANGGTTVGVVGMNERVDDDFAEDFNRDAPDVLAADF